MFLRRARSQSLTAVKNKEVTATRSNGVKGPFRSNSLPVEAVSSRRAGAASRKGILKVLTVDESLSCTYGSSSSSASSSSTDSGGILARIPGSSRIRRKKIVFKDVLIREYARTIGDNPSCSSGPPISISWEYYPQLTPISLDEYENSRPQRRTHYEMVIPREVRQQMLRKEWDITQAQIAAAVRANVKIKNQRRTTVNNLPKTAKIEEIVENAGRKFMQGLSLKKKESAQLEKQWASTLKKSRTQFDFWAAVEEEEKNNRTGDVEEEEDEDDDDADSGKASSEQ